MLFENETQELMELLDTYNWESEDLTQEEQEELFDKIEDYLQYDFDCDFVVYGKIENTMYRFDLQNYYYETIE